MNIRSNRREFLKRTTLAGVGFWVAGGGAPVQSKSPNEKLNLGIIGSGGRGGSNLNDVAGENIVALCDVDEQSAGATFQKFPKAKKYNDYRKMPEEMDREIDAVVVATPDHTHAPASMMAMKMGKHVYCEKPLTHSVYEARALTEAASKYKVVTQMGNQGTSGDGLREAVEVVRAGAIGPVREVHVWTNRPIWPQGAGALLENASVRTALHGSRGGNPPAIPSTLHWDLWLGVAPDRIYDPCYLPFKWRGWLDFGTGALGDMACHTANMAFMACNLGYPTSVEAEFSESNSETFPMWSVIRYQFPARGDLPPLKWTWYDGGNDKPAWVNKHLKELAKGNDIPGSGSLLVGDKGILFSPDDYGTSYKLLPESDFVGFKPPTPSLPRSPGHHQEWINGCKGGPKPMSNFSYAGLLTETVLLGVVAIRAGKKIEWDGPNLKVTNIPEANNYVRREYRKGWSL